MALHFKDIETNREIIEDELNEDSLFKRQYDIANRIFKELVSNEGIENRKYNNIIAFCGDRGTGKSSCMKSFMSQKQKDDNYNCLFLKSIDPSFFDESHNILELVIGQLYENVCKHTQKENANEEEKFKFQDRRSKLLLQFDQIMRDLKFLAKAEDRERFYDCLQELDALSVGISLSERISNLMKSCLIFLDDKPLLVISIDDLDLNIKGAYMMSEHIRKYLTNEMCIILIGVKVNQLIESISINLSKEEKVSPEEAFRMAYKYVNKLIPMASRVNMPILDDYRNLQLVYTTADGIDNPFHSVQEAVTHQIFWKTGYLFYNSKGRSSYIVPRSLRSLRQLLHMLDPLPIHQREQTKLLHENQVIFKDYFWNTWTQQLDDDNRMIVNKLADTSDYQTFNKRILDTLKEIDNNDNLSSAQYAYNITMGDVFAELNRLINTVTDYQTQLLLFFIQTLCSMRMYEAYDEITENVNEELYPTADNNGGEIYTTDALFASTNKLQRIINGRYFNYQSNEVLPFKGKADNPRDLVLIDGIELSDELKRIGAIVGEPDNIDKIKFNTLEYIMLCVSRHVILKRKSDDYSNIPITSNPVYISSFNYRTKNLLFDVLAPFFNVINLKMTYERFNDSFQNGNPNCPSLYDYAINKNWTLLYKLVNSNARGYDDPMRSLMSDAVIRNGEVLTAINERIKSVRNHKYNSTESNRLLKEFYELITDTDMHTYPRNPMEEPYDISFRFLTDIINVLDSCDVNYLDCIYAKQKPVRLPELDEIFTRPTYRQVTIINKLSTNRQDIYQLKTKEEWKQVFLAGIDIPSANIIDTINEILQPNE